VRRQAATAAHSPSAMPPTPTPTTTATGGAPAPFRLVGNGRFVRSNPRTDRFHALAFHHVELWCSDAASAAGRFSFGLGAPLAARCDLSTGNSAHASLLRASVAAGARPAFEPVGFRLAEVQLYGDVVLRYVSYPDDEGLPFLPGSRT
jgi:hypothetical protein